MNDGTFGQTEDETRGTGEERTQPNTDVRLAMDTDPVVKALEDDTQTTAGDNVEDISEAMEREQKGILVSTTEVSAENVARLVEALDMREAAYQELLADLQGASNRNKELESQLLHSQARCDQLEAVRDQILSDQFGVPVIDEELNESQALCDQAYEASEAARATALRAEANLIDARMAQLKQHREKSAKDTVQ